MIRRSALPYLFLLSLAAIGSACGDDTDSPDASADASIASDGNVDEGADGSTDGSDPDAATGDSGPPDAEVGGGTNDAGSDAAVDGGPDAGPCVTNEDCADGELCNGVEVCNNGTCEAGTPLTCEDIDLCTTDACDEINDVCTNVFDPACTVCSPDQFEPDDTRASAVPTSTGTYTGLYACLNNEDWHAFTVGNNELIEVLVAFQDAIGDINLRLYGPSGGQVAASLSGNDDEYIAYTATAGTYLLLVDFNDTSGDDDDIPGNRYSMDVQLGEACTDRFEDDDTLATASPQGTGTESGLRACPYDDDWFAVTVVQNQLILASALFEDSEGDIDLRLYDSAGQQVAASLASSDDEHIAYTARSAGTYYVRVILNHNQDDVDPGVDYDLVVDLDSACTDFLEDNDTLGGSSVVTDGSYALNSCPADDDWFQFEARTNEIIDISALFESAYGNIDLRLYDATGAQIAASLSGTDDENILITAPYTGRYYLRVLLPGPDDVVPGNDYALTIDTSARCTDPYEDNDVQVRASPLGSGTFIDMHACPADEDWYELPIGAAGTIDVQINFANANGNIDARLYDPSGAQVAAGLSGSDNESFTFDASHVGTYWLRIYLAVDDVTPGAPYTLIVSGADACAPTTCADESAQCGALADRCGGTLSCGTCTTGSCSANNLCACTPATCTTLGASCGLSDDGCGDLIDCGTCTGGELCGGAYVANVCASQQCVDDALEDNDSLATSGAIASGLTANLVACPSDDDYYSVTLASNDLLIASAMFSDVRGNLDLRLYNDAGTQVDASLGSGDDERVVYTAPAAGSYHLRALLAGSDDELPGVAYSLSIASNPCTDAYEDNDSLATAASLGEGSHSALTACPNDDDWYRITLASNEVLDVRATFVDAAGDLDLRLYDAGGSQVAASLSGTDDEQITYGASSGGDYFLRVLANEGADDRVPGNGYALDIIIDSGCVDLFEDNDDRLTAAPMSPGSYPGLTMCPADEDWYRFIADDNTVIVIDAAFTHADGNIDMRLYDARGQQIAASLSGTDDERIALTTPSEGTFALRMILGNDPAPPGNTYALSLSANTECTDVFENNDAQGRAYLLGSGSFPSLTSCPGDEDWYALDVSQGAALNIALTFTHANGNVDLRLYDPTGEQVAASLSGNDDEAISYTAAVSGRYYLRVLLASDDLVPGNGYGMTVSGAAACLPTVSCAGALAQCGPLHDGCGTMLDCGLCGGGGTCSLNNICNCVPDDCNSLAVNCGFIDDGCGTRVECGTCDNPEVCDGAYMQNVCAAPSCPQDSLEDNDSQQAAPEMTDGDYADLTICPGDDDWYELDLGNNVVIRSRFEFDDTKGNVDMRLYNASGTQIDASLSGSNDEQISYTTPAAGTYYVRAQIVGVDDAVPGNRYRFLLDTSQQCTDPYEDNDRDVDSVLLGSGSYPGLTSCPNDEDWYELVLGNNELIEVDLAFQDALGNIDLRLYDAAGQQLAASLSGSDDERIAITTLQSGVYRLRVLFNGGTDDIVSGNAYDLSLDLGVACTDVFEDSDTRLTAAVLPFGATNALTSCPSDDDWYQINIAANRRLILDTTFTHASGNIDVRLFDAAGTQVAAALSGNDNEQINYVTPQAGPFYARVYLSNDDATPGNVYSLTLTDTAP